MEFIIKNINKSINDLMRTIGYQPAYFKKDGEFSMVKKIGRNDYPRFHVYIRELHQVSNSIELDTKISESGGRKNYNFSIHLDQKKLSYKGNHAHSGEYEGNIIEVETERIKSLL